MYGGLTDESRVEVTLVGEEDPEEAGKEQSLRGLQIRIGMTM